jgi:hypothetical protein
MCNAGALSLAALRQLGAKLMAEEDRGVPQHM